MKNIKRVITLIIAFILFSSMSNTVSASTAQTPVSATTNKEDNEIQKELTDDLPTYMARAFEFVNNGHPAFTEEELKNTKETSYSNQDSLNRSGICVAYLGPESIQKTERKDKDTKNPAGWDSVLFEGSKDEYMYARTRLIGWKLDGAKEDIRNLLTGTAFFANDGMAFIETIVAEYIETSRNHVLYRATPVYKGNNLLSEGVLIEAESVEDNGAGLQICVYCYNLQPGIEIDYATGKVLSAKIEKLSPLEVLTAAATTVTGTRSVEDTNSKDQSLAENNNTPAEESTLADVVTYIGNKNTKKFHKPNCNSVNQMKEKNKVFFYGDRTEPIGKGYDPCGNCHP